VRPRKRFAQHFLEPPWVAKLISAIAPKPTDYFIEIGPGQGVLTFPLAARCAHVMAIEIDRDLAASLQRRAPPNVSIMTADVLSVDLAELATRLVEQNKEPMRVAGNLPYNISSPILFQLLQAGTTGQLDDATLMLQKEVADRLVAKPGTRDYGVLTLTTALGADVTRVLSLPPGAFRPPPKVHSAVVRLAFRPPPPQVKDTGLVVDIVRAIFTQRRKTLANALAPFATARDLDSRALLNQAGLDAGRRPETLALPEVARLADVIRASTRGERPRT
jgi:16S rRNA (adenine1518-N6/adenine1519-N6)-dimethyltransferase